MASLGEGGENGVITPEKSVVFSVLENCLCLIVRQLPQISPALASSTGTVLQNAKCTKILTENAATLVLSALKVLVQLPTLCSYAGMLFHFQNFFYIIDCLLFEKLYKYNLSQLIISIIL